MRKKILLILSAAVFLTAALGGGAWLWLSPRGAWNASSPENAVADYLNTHDAAFFREQFLSMARPEVGAFETREMVSGALFDAATGEFSFREQPERSAWKSPAYLISRGDTDLFTAVVTWDGQSWQVSELACADLLTCEKRTLSVTVPEGTRVTLNGLPVEESYITETDVPYEDMSALELSLPGHPHRVKYEIPGICLAAEVTAEREGGTFLLSSDGTSWDYTVAEPGAHTLCVTAPDTAVVSVAGVALSPEQAASTVPFATTLTTDAAMDSLLPAYLVYSFGGLYGEYEVTATLDGEPLTGDTVNGTLTFSLPGDEALRESTHERVEEFLRRMVLYGAGWAGPLEYCVYGSEAQQYFSLAAYSVIWITSTNVDFETIEAYDFVPAGDDAFICKGRVVCTSTTAFNSWPLDMHYEMLWVRSGETWLVQDLAFL